MPDPIESLFFKYFKDELTNVLLWDENEWWPIIQGVAKSFDHAREDMQWVKDQYSVSTCEPEFLDLYGKSRGLKRFPFETQAQWELRVKGAFEYWKSAGKTETIKAWLETANINAELVEYEEGKDLPHLSHMEYAEFHIEFILSQATAEERKYARLLIGELKRASARGLLGFLSKREVDGFVPDDHFSTFLFNFDGPSVAPTTTDHFSTYRFNYETSPAISERAITYFWGFDSDQLAEGEHHTQFNYNFETTGDPKVVSLDVPIIGDKSEKDGITYWRTIGSDWNIGTPVHQPWKTRIGYTT